MKHQHQFIVYLVAGSVFALAILLITSCRSTATTTPLAVEPVVSPVTATFTPTTAPTVSPLSAATTPITFTTPTPASTLTPTPITTSLPIARTPTKPPTGSGSAVKVYTTTLTLPTYPIWDYLTEQVDPVYNLPVYYFNRPAYEAANPAPAPKDYSAVVLENDYLRLTFLPQLGGRLYSAIIKTSGQEIFYHNPVVKPSRYGVLQPYEANWWLATGGMEWAYPTQEHGYRFGVPWQYHVTQSAAGATITLSDIAPNRVGVVVKVTLPADSPVFTVEPQFINSTSQPVPLQFWVNAALTLGAGSMSPQTRFILPVEQVTVHSRGAEGWEVPDAREKSPWPRIGQNDLRDYSQWANYLGNFAPYLAAPFTGAYNPDTNLAVARLIEPGQVPGSKLFAFGRNFPDKSYTDDNSQYFEIWGGANTGFWPEADVTVPPGGMVGWQESWWPLAGLGGLTWANSTAALHADQRGDTLDLSLLLARPGRGKIEVLTGDPPLWAEPFEASPSAPLQWTIPAPSQPIHIQIVDDTNAILLDYQLCEDCQDTK